MMCPLHDSCEFKTKFAIDLKQYFISFNKKNENVMGPFADSCEFKIILKVNSAIDLKKNFISFFNCFMGLLF